DHGRRPDPGRRLAEPEAARPRPHLRRREMSGADAPTIRQPPHPSSGGAMYLQKYDLSGRRALVTGGAQGIGRACCEALVEAGADLVIADLNGDAAGTAAEALSATGGRRVEAVALDVTDSSAVEALADRLSREGRPVDILVNNAGVARSNVPAEETSDDHWRF